MHANYPNDPVENDSNNMRLLKSLKAISKFTGLIAVTFAITNSHANTLRISGAGDLTGLDPHSRNEAFSNRFLRQVYEPLLSRDAQLKAIPGLATSWSNTSENRWQVKLRTNVKFAEGQSFTANDVVFSIERAQHESSAIRQYALGLGRPIAKDAHTLEFDTGKPNPVFLDQLALVPIMNLEWSRSKNCLVPASFQSKQETPCTVASNGTGAIKITQWKADIETRYERNKNWWGSWEGKGNLQKAIYRPAPLAASRLAALLSGDIDLIFDVSPTELNTIEKQAKLKVFKATENRIVYFGFDQRAKSAFAKDELRQALALAIDHKAIQEKVYRGFSTPSASLVMPNVPGYKAKHETHQPFDVDRAKKLIKSLGLPNNFSIRLGCPTDRHPSDVALCSALTTMWTKLGIKVNLSTMPKAIYFERLSKAHTSGDSGFDMFLMSWGGATTDPQFTLGPLVQTIGKNSEGSANYGHISNPNIDRSLKDSQHQMKTEVRAKLLESAIDEHQAETHHIVMNRQMLIWVGNKNITLPMRADGVLDFSQIRQ